MGRAGVTHHLNFGKIFFRANVMKNSAFSGKYHVKFGNFVIFRTNIMQISGILLFFRTCIFGQKCLPPKSCLNSHAYDVVDIPGDIATRLNRSFIR